MFKDCIGRGLWNLRIFTTSLFWIKVAALPTASAFKISFATSAWARAPEEMQNRSSLTSTSNGFMKLWKAVISVSRSFSPRSLMTEGLCVPCLL